MNKKESYRLVHCSKEEKEKEEIEYQFSIVDIPLNAGEKLYGYVATYNFDTLIKIGLPVRSFGLPKKLYELDLNF